MSKLNKGAIQTWFPIIVGTVIVLLISGGILAWQYLETPKEEEVPLKEIPKDETTNWKTYRNEEYGFEVKYPNKLQLSKEGNKVILNHSIPYENNGDCDMLGIGQPYKTLDDFDVSFEVVDQKLSLTYIDGEYSAGMLKGSWAYGGAEGCGHSTYYFSIGENKTLVVQKAAVQALSGISTMWNLEEILKIPGVISKQESEKLFNEILSTFKLVQ